MSTIEEKVQQMLIAEVPVEIVAQTEQRLNTGRCLGVQFAQLSTNDPALKSALVTAQVAPRDENGYLLDGADGRADCVSPDYTLTGEAGYDAAGVVLRAVCGNFPYEQSMGIVGMTLLQGLAVLHAIEEKRLEDLATQEEEGE